MAGTDWVLVYSSEKPYRIEIVKAILEENSIKSFEVDKRDSSYVIFGEIELYVEVKDAPIAKIIIDQNPPVSNFWKRALFGALFVAIVIGSVLGGKYSLLGLLMLIAVLGLWELYTLCERDEIYPQKLAGSVLGIIPFIVAFQTSAMDDAGILAVCGFIILFPFLLFFFELFRKKNKPFANIAMTLLGVLYIPVTLIMFYIISYLPMNPVHAEEEVLMFHPYNLLGYFFILWSYDTGAYLAGSKFGKHKLWVRLSPGKTWEGVAGGAILAMTVAHFISNAFTDLSRTNWLVMTVIIMITGTLGDLTKSMFKRSINVKDSGNIIPGHGGILDRFDALFLSAPFVLCYLFLVK